MGVQIQSPRCTIKLIMMLLLCLLITSPWLARAGNPKPLGQGTGNDQYKPVDPSYSTPDEVYKAGDKDDRHPVEEIVYENQCIPYVEKTCRTSQKEMCKDDFQCVDIDYQYCWDEDKTVKDRTCIFSVDFDCKKQKPYDGKGAVQCERTPTKKCYDTPRKVQEEICKPQTSKYCEKFTNEFPFPVEKQNCHTEPMKKCELESRA